MSYTETLDEYAYRVLRALPADIRHQIDMANQDLYFGPTYLDKDNEPVSMFDETYDHPFDFMGACAAIREKLGKLYPAWYHFDFDEIYEQDTQHLSNRKLDALEAGGWSRIEQRDLITAIVGKELAHHVA